MTIDEMIDEMIEDVLRHEGGFVNHKNDRGGPTNLGITQDTLSAWLGRAATINELKSLTKENAAKIYKKKYYLDPNIELLPDIIRPIVFDVSVNSGPYRAIKMLQQILFDKGYPVGKADGIIGKKTLAFANHWVSSLGVITIDTLIDYRIKFYKKIIDSNPSQKVFEKGWIARANSFKIHA